MIIRNIEHNKEYEVFGVAVYSNVTWDLPKRIVFYVADDKTIGLGVENLEYIQIIDSSFGGDFRMHLIRGGEGIMILWDHFVDTAQFGRLMDLDEEALAAFETARVKRATLRTSIRDAG